MSEILFVLEHTSNFVAQSHDYDEAEQEVKPLITYAKALGVIYDLEIRVMWFDAGSLSEFPEVHCPHIKQGWSFHFKAVRAKSWLNTPLTTAAIKLFEHIYSLEEFEHEEYTIPKL